MKQRLRLPVLCLLLALSLGAGLPARPAAAEAERPIFTAGPYELDRDEAAGRLGQQARQFGVGAHGLPDDELQEVELRFPTNWSRYGTVQSDLWELNVAPGPLTLWLESDGTPVTMRVQLKDVLRDRLVIDQTVRFRDSHTFDLPAVEAGRYWLSVSYNRAVYVGARGIQLQLSPVTPALELPAMTPFETHNGLFTVQPRLHNAPTAEWVSVLLGNTRIYENILRPDGTPQAVQLDATGLADGIYDLTLMGKARGANNLGVTGKPFLVDRVDTFPDVPRDHWAHLHVEVMYHLGIAGGRSSGLFDPAATVTRAEFAKLLAGTLGVQSRQDAPSPFADTAGHWAEPYIVALWEAGLAQGYLRDGARSFLPEQALTRAEAATMIGRALGVSDWPVTGDPFTDWSQVPQWARPAVAALAEFGWINGYPDGSYRPAEVLQRDQAAKVLAKFLGM